MWNTWSCVTCVCLQKSAFKFHKLQNSGHPRCPLAAQRGIAGQEPAEDSTHQDVFNQIWIYSEYGSATEAASKSFSVTCSPTAASAHVQLNNFHLELADLNLHNSEPAKSPKPSQPTLPPPLKHLSACPVDHYVHTYESEV